MITSREPGESLASSAIGVIRFAGPAHSTASRRPDYRADVDGLRAIAVLSVVGFHAFPDWVKGGFVGVDIFFVISGFLISGILFGALDAGRFSLAEFYSRRARRLFGALCFVLIATLAAGWFLLVAEDYKALGLHVAGGAAFAANLLEWHESGYFANAAETRPLLHLWSLGVEEQFYLAWPAAVYLAWRRRLGVLLLVASALIASFVVNVASVRTDTIAAFYAPQSRAWELMAGSLLAWVAMRRPRSHEGMGDVAAWAGIALVAAAILEVNKESAFPGWWAVLPTAGTSLLIAAGSNAWVNRTVLAHPSMRFFGLISYPLYLWHWPLLAFARITQFGAPSRLMRIALVAASVGLAWLTWRLVERPMRQDEHARTKVLLLCGTLALLLAGGLVVYETDGIAIRPIDTDERAAFIHHYEDLHRYGLTGPYRAECSFYDSESARAREAIDESCVRAGERGTVFLWGDSHAMALSPGIRAVLPKGVSLAQVATNSCKPSLESEHLERRGDSCYRSNAFAREQIARLRPDVVVLAQLNHHSRTDWESFADFIHAAGGQKVVLAGPVPRWSPALPLVIAKHHWGKPHDRIATGLDQEVGQEDLALEKRYGRSQKLAYVSLASRLCDGMGCLATVPGRQGLNLMVADESHLTPEASVFVASSILKPFVTPVEPSARSR